MARHQGDNKPNRGSGRQGGYRSDSNTRGNAPIGRRVRPEKSLKNIDSDEVRLNKFLSNAGVCTRKEADIYIQSGVVHVNDTPVTELGYKVKLTDKVTFDGRVITPGERIYLLLNKPKNFSTSSKILEKNAAYLLKNATSSPITSIGKMDHDTTGLIVYSNDQVLIEKLSRPKQTSPKIYQVTLTKNFKKADLEAISKGVKFDEHFLRVDEISFIEGASSNEVGIKLSTANVSVVRSIFEKFGYKVEKVDRVSFAGLTKKNLARGQWRNLTKQEIINLMNS